jgi:hypothetical protein
LFDHFGIYDSGISSFDSLPSAVSYSKMINFASNLNFGVYSIEEIVKHILRNIINIYVS